MTHTLDPLPPSPCPLCGELRDEEYARQKWGWEEHDTALPAAAGRLTVVRDLRPGETRELQLRQCPVCGAYFLYRTDYEYLVNGSEDEQFLTRLTAEQAAGYLG
jgi:uncharacterized C2H2 Zn-finger protein